MSYHPDNSMKFRYMLASIIAGGLLLLPCGCKSKNKPGASGQPDGPSAVTPSEEPKIAAKPRQPAGEQFYEWALNGDLENIQAELDNAVDVNSTNPEGRSALMLAAFNGHTQIVDLLIAQGGKVNHQDQAGRTALMYAASGDNLPTVRLLLARQAKV
ncbi:MAG: ankyrin repeat domain-containing protein, partial [Phycisphaerae bacterium]|nr:ankyrin repeat domain-containing protein [Phycisphaerae bacterium]